MDNFLTTRVVLYDFPFRFITDRGLHFLLSSLDLLFNLYLLYLVSSFVGTLLKFLFTYTALSIVAGVLPYKFYDQP